MEKSEVSKIIQNFIQQNTENFIEDYIKEHEKNIGFLRFYPLIALEEKYINAKDKPEKEASKVYMMSWFISNINSRISISNYSDFRFDEREYEHFKGQYLEVIEKKYWNYKVQLGINDTFSPVGYSLEEVDNMQYRLTWPLISEPLPKEQIYFLMTFDKEKMENEKEIKMKPIYYLYSLTTHNPFLDIDVLNKMLSKVDESLYLLCMECVKVDIQKLGRRVKSPVIKSSEDAIKVIGYFYYFSLVNKSIFSLSTVLMGNVNVGKSLIKVSKKKLKESIMVLTGISENSVEDFINYFIFKGEGSINEYPLFELQGYIYWSPFSWILNDFQFSIVNGHYYKDIKFENRDKTISHSIVKEIIEKVENYENILLETEFYYEYKIEDKLYNSDIDVAMFDTKSNTLLLVECKWKDNFYAIAGEESYRKIYQGLRKIYKEQMSKHKYYVEQIEGSVNKIFGSKLEEDIQIEEINIFYIVVDKRSQLYIDEMNLVPLFGLLYLLETNAKEKEIELHRVVEYISNFNTEVEYINGDTNYTYEIDNGILLLTEDLYINS